MALFLVPFFLAQPWSSSSPPSTPRSLDPVSEMRALGFNVTTLPRSREAIGGRFYDPRTGFSGDWRPGVWVGTDHASGNCADVTVNVQFPGPIDRDVLAAKLSAQEKSSLGYQFTIDASGLARIRPGVSSQGLKERWHVALAQIRVLRKHLGEPITGKPLGRRATTSRAFAEGLVLRSVNTADLKQIGEQYGWPRHRNAHDVAREEFALVYGSNGRIEFQLWTGLSDSTEAALGNGRRAFQVVRNMAPSDGRQRIDVEAARALMQHWRVEPNGNGISAISHVAVSRGLTVGAIAERIQLLRQEAAAASDRLLPK